jgi:hypothetical protein
MKLLPAVARAGGRENMYANATHYCAIANP